MPLDETLLEPVGIDEALLEPADPGEEVLRAAPQPSLPVQLTPYGPTVSVPYPSWLDTARRTLIGPSPDEAALLEQRALPRVSPAERLGVLGLLNKPTVTLPEWPRLEGDVPISAYPSVAAAAIWNALVKPAVEGFSSPGGIASAGALGVARGLAQAGRLGAARAVAAPGAAVFGAPMAVGAPEAVRRFGAATAEGDLQQQLETGAGAALTLTAPVGLAGAALRPGTPLPPRIELPPALAAQLPPALPRPVVPRGPSVARPPRPRPEVPATPAEPYEPILATIRNADARTVAQIQQLFPKAQLSREQARALRNQAFPPGPTAPPTEPPPTVPRGTPPPEPPAARPTVQKPVASLQKPVSKDLPTPEEWEILLAPDPKRDLKDLGVTPENVEALISGRKTPQEVVDQQLGIKVSGGSLEAETMFFEEHEGGGRSFGFSPEAGPAASPPVFMGQMSHVDAIQLAREQAVEQIHEVLRRGRLSAPLEPVAPAPASTAPRATELDRLTTLEDAGMLTPAQSARLTELRTPSRAPEPPPAAPAAPAPSPEPPPAVPARPTPISAAPEALAAPELFIPALNLAESDLAPGKLKTLPMRDPAQLARLEKYFGVKGVPALTRKVQERFAAMRAEAEPKPTVEEPQVAPEPPAAAPAPEPAAPVAPPAVETKLQGEVTTTAKAQGFRAATEVKKELTKRLQFAIADAPKRADLGGKRPTTVTLDIPGDGTFTLVNTKEALGQVLAGAKRLETSAKPSTPSAFTKVRPPTPPKALTGKERVLRPLARFVSDDPTRFNLQSAWSDGEYAMATNGRMLIRFKQDYGGSKKDPRKFDPVTNSDVEGAETVGGLLQGMEQIWPKGEDYVPVGVIDVDELFQAARNAKVAFRDSRENPWVTLHVGKTGKVGMVGVVEDLSEEVRVGDTSLPALERPYNADYLLEIASAAAEAGSKRVQVGMSKSQGSQWAVVFKGDDWDAILMGKAPEKVEPAAEAPPAEQPPMPPGPGAASPLEFEQRAARNAADALAGRRPPGTSPPVTTPPPLPPAQPSASVERTPYDVVSPINSPQFTYWFGRLGNTAASAWEKLALGSLEIRESIGRDVQRYVDQTLASLPRQYRKAGGRAFFDVLDGKTPAEIEAAYRDQPGGDRIIAAAEAVKTRLEAIRTTIRDVKREASAAALKALDKPTLQSMFSESISADRDTAAMTKQELADALTLAAYPDDWGYADGSYMPHLFYGEYKVSMQRPGDEGRTFVLRAETELAAKAALHKYVRDNPEYADLPWFIERDAVTPGDMVRLGDRRYWRLVSDMKESGEMTTAEVKEALRGNVGRKSSKQKWWGSLQRRFGYANYERDYRRVLTSYLVGFHRWRVLSRLNREVVPMIESVRAEGRPNAANGLTDILEYMWGRPSKSSEFVDSVLRAIPGVKQIVKPLALERWSRATRSLVSGLLLRTLRYAVVNRLGPLQGLYPLLGERIMVKAKALHHTAEGRRLLDEANVRFDPGQYGEHTFIVPSKVRSVIEGWSGERSNQELSYLAMYLHAREQGLAHADAIPYAKLRGQLLTQFTPIAADIPPIMRGPFTGMLFQYKRFPIKQVELLYHMGRSGAVGGIARWLAMMALAGGAAFYMRQFWLPKDTRKRFRNGLVEIVGERGADAIMYGVPGMLGVDLSTSLTLGDEPWGENIYERIGRALVGPTASLAAETGAALLTPKRQPTTTREDVETMLHRFPSLRPLAELSRMLRGDVDLKAPDGETRYRRLFSESLKGLGSFRSTAESNQRIGVDAALTVDKERQALKNAYFVAAQSPDPAVLDAAILKVQQFNARWPEFGLTAREIIDYIKYRNRGLNQSDIDRIVGKRYRSMLPPERTEEE